MTTLQTQSAPALNVQYRAGAVARRRRGRRHPERWLALIAILMICAGFLLPFVWMLSTSLKTVDKTVAYPPQFFPSPIVPGNYWKVITSDKVDFPLYTRNTLIIALLAVTGTTLSSAIVAYGFARIRFRGRGPLFALMLSTMLIPFA